MHRGGGTAIWGGLRRGSPNRAHSRAGARPEPAQAGERPLAADGGHGADEVKRGQDAHKPRCLRVLHNEMVHGTLRHDRCRLQQAQLGANLSGALVCAAVRHKGTARDELAHDAIRRNARGQRLQRAPWRYQIELPVAPHHHDSTLPRRDHPAHRMLQCILGLASRHRLQRLHDHRNAGLVRSGLGRLQLGVNACEPPGDVQGREHTEPAAPRALRAFHHKVVARVDAGLWRGEHQPSCLHQSH
mmetsp:Transcript_40824/g.117273  ORF Transcript_40824/g.117273 Transcript_40824/m.117273 type:complete len:244 (+) Transcript_40824:115-846(+)